MKYFRYFQTSSIMMYFRLLDNVDACMTQYDIILRHKKAQKAFEGFAMFCCSADAKQTDLRYKNQG